MFKNILDTYDHASIKNEIYSRTADDVRRALSASRRTPEDFMSLVSPAALPFLEEMAQKSHASTLKHFGKTIQLYLPLYLSNECYNQCRYCGFKRNNNIKRITLTEEEILAEVKAIKSFGYEHILLVTGDAPDKAGVEYLKNAIRLIKPYFSLIAMEVQALREEDYKELIDVGLNTVYIYQETYNRDTYAYNHPSGKKADFNYRLATPDRLGKAGIYKTGIGALLGLDDWRTDSFFTAMHLKYLERTYWKTKYCISFPRLRPYAGQQNEYRTITDKELAQLICAYRLWDEEVELSISTRESITFRNHIIKLGITSMSAGSRTNPGGYASHNESLEQFAPHDDRSPQEIEKMIKESGYEAVWKDWDVYMQ